MAFAYALDVAAPIGTDLVRNGALEFRNLKSAITERVNSFFVNVNTDPWTVKDNATLGNVNVKKLTPVADATYALGDATHRFTNLFLSGLADITTGRFTGNSLPAAGSGVEVGYNGGIGFLQTYNRTGAAYLPLDLTGLTIRLVPNGNTANAISIASTGAVTIAAGGLTVVGLGGGTGAFSVDAVDTAGVGFRRVRVPN